MKKVILQLLLTARSPLATAGEPKIRNCRWTAKGLSELRRYEMKGSEGCERLKWKEPKMSEAPCRTKKAVSEKEGGTAKSLTALL